MSFSSFIFYVNEQPDNCGCYHDCNCPQYTHDITVENNVEDAVEYLVRKIKQGNIWYLDRIFVNGVPLYNTSCILNRNGKIKFLNPIDLDSVMIRNHYDDTIVPLDLGLNAATLLHTVFEAVGPLVEDYIIQTNEKFEESQTRIKNQNAERDRKEFERLKKMFPDA